MGGLLHKYFLDDDLHSETYEFQSIHCSFHASSWKVILIDILPCEICVDFYCQCQWLWVRKERWQSWNYLSCFEPQCKFWHSLTKLTCLLIACDPPSYWAHGGPANPKYLIELHTFFCFPANHWSLPYWFFSFPEFWWNWYLKTKCFSGTRRKP